jgi:hypothetical protein
VLRVGLRNVSFALRPGVLVSIGARARYPLVAAAITQGAILVSSIVLARVMGKHLFGAYGMILTIQVVFFTASNLRLSSILPAFIAPVRDDLSQINRISSTAWFLTMGPLLCWGRCFSPVGVCWGSRPLWEWGTWRRSSR